MKVLWFIHCVIKLNISGQTSSWGLENTDFRQFLPLLTKRRGDFCIASHVCFHQANQTMKGNKRGYSVLCSIIIHSTLLTEVFKITDGDLWLSLTLECFADPCVFCVLQELCQCRPSDGNCSCCKECMLCLGNLWEECCDCVGECSVSCISAAFCSRPQVSQHIIWGLEKLYGWAHAPRLSRLTVTEPAEKGNSARNTTGDGHLWKESVPVEITFQLFVSEFVGFVLDRLKVH